MINIIIASDEQDVDLGVYFASCHADLIAVIDSENAINNKFVYHELSASQSNPIYLEATLKELSESPFIGLAYMHGNDDFVGTNNSTYVKAGEDNTFFKYTLFYTNSCSSGKKLGPDLIHQGCYSFIGYDQPTVAFKSDLQDLSINCDNSGIVIFLTTDVTIYEAFKSMKQYYTQKSDRLLLLGDILSSGLLVNAREALVFEGNKDLRKADLNIED